MVQSRELTTVIQDLPTRTKAGSLRALEDERTYENIVVAGLFSIMVVVVLVQYLQNQSGSRLEVSSSAHATLAANSGLVWIQMTPAGQPNQVKIIAENSTGAFEEVLLGLTT